MDEGKIQHFTGVDDPYEEPEQPELVIETDKQTVAESVQAILAKLVELGYLDREEKETHLALAGVHVDSQGKGE